jgi:hypothetical protein
MKRREFIISGFALSMSSLFGCSKRKEEPEGTTLTALGETLFQKGFVSSKNFDREGFNKEMKIYFNKIPADGKMGLKWLMRFFEFSPIIFLYSFKRFSSLPLKKREEFIRKMAKSRFKMARLMLFSIKTIPTLYYFSDEDLKKELGINYKA